MQWRRWGSNLRPLCLESSTLPLSHCTPVDTCEGLMRMISIFCICSSMIQLFAPANKPMFKDKVYFEFSFIDGLYFQNTPRPTNVRILNVSFNYLVQALLDNYQLFSVWNIMVYTISTLSLFLVNITSIYAYCMKWLLNWNDFFNTAHKSSEQSHFQRCRLLGVTLVHIKI